MPPWRQPRPTASPPEPAGRGRLPGARPGYGNAELPYFSLLFAGGPALFRRARRGIPVKVALYNYLDTPQDFHVEIVESEDFELLDDPTQTVEVAPREVGGVEFGIRLTDLGPMPIKVTARSRRRQTP